ncbi:hypothetical protein OM427_12345 [Halomonas sp. 18H]|nr:hypothetical protein [Halomonas sp. 18H]MCW4150312.1 hypothetical protein [Halomonas sp. 18H]
MRKMTLSASALVLGLAAGSAIAGNNDLFIQQVNDYNFANGSQTGNNNETFIRQTDNNNGASVPVIGNGNDMLVIQETRRNFAEAAMGSGGNQNRTAILQSGGDENLTLGPNASGGAGGQGDRNTFASVQNGSNNVVNGGGARGPEGTGLGGGSWSIDNISTQGSFDSSLVPSGIPGPAGGTGSGHSVLAGSDNVTLLGQVGSDNRFGVMTVGNRNTISGFANSGSLSSVDMNNEAGASFFGDKGLADTTLGADDAFASNGAMSWAVSGFATQEGVNNVAHLVQQGDDNTIAFNQISSDNTAQIYQQGNMNGAMAVQN